MTPKGHRVIRGRRDLLYDPKGHGDLCGRFDLVYDLLVFSPKTCLQILMNRDRQRNDESTHPWCTFCQIFLDRAIHPSEYLHFVNPLVSAKQSGDSFPRRLRCINSCKLVLGGDSGSECTIPWRAVTILGFH